MGLFHCGRSGSFLLKFLSDDFQFVLFASVTRKPKSVFLHCLLTPLSQKVPYHLSLRSTRQYYVYTSNCVQSDVQRTTRKFLGSILTPRCPGGGHVECVGGVCVFRELLVNTLYLRLTIGVKIVEVNLRIIFNDLSPLLFYECRRVTGQTVKR